MVGALYVNTKAKDDNGYCFPYNVTGNMTADSYKQFYARLTNRMIYTSNRTLNRADHLLTIATDSALHPGWKFVLVAAKDGEVRDVRMCKRHSTRRRTLTRKEKRTLMRPLTNGIRRSM